MAARAEADGVSFRSVQEHRNADVDVNVERGDTGYVNCIQCTAALLFEDTAIRAAAGEKRCKSKRSVMLHYQVKERYFPPGISPPGLGSGRALPTESHRLTSWVIASLRV